MIGKITRIAIICFFLSICLIDRAFSVDVKVTSTVNPTKVPLNDRIKITVDISGADAFKTSKPELKNSPDDFIINETGQLTRTEIINGIISRGKSYTYTLYPRKTGTFDVGAITVKLGTRLFSAPATKVEVIAGNVPQTQPAPPSSQRSTRDIMRSRSGNDTIFIRTFVDSEEPYVGEQITMTFELYSRVRLFDNSYSPPSTTGFWTIKLPDIPATQKIDNNRLYNYNTIKTALFATTSGKLTIGEARLTYKSGGFFSLLQSRTISTDSITISVKPLPENGKPVDFSGTVGSFTISASADKKSFTVGDVVTITVTVTGKGNLDLISSVKAPGFSAFKTYDPKVNETISNSGFVVGGAKSWEYVLIPRRQGELTVERFTLSYFNPEDESYHTLATEPIELSILPGDTSAFTQTTRDISGKAIQRIANDIHFIKPDKTILKSTHKQVYAHSYFYFLYLVPLVIFLTTFTVKKRLDTIERNTGLKRRLNAWKHAQKRLSEASQMVKSGQTCDFCGKLSETVIEYIGDRLNLDTGTMTSTSLENIIKTKGVSPEMAEHIRKTLEFCDFVQFSSDDTKRKIHENLLNETKSIINSLKEIL